MRAFGAEELQGGIWNTLLTLVVVVACQSGLLALTFEAFGPADGPIRVSPGWPKGAEPLLRHASRVYMQDTNGSQHTYYEGDIDQVNELLELFGKLDIKRRHVILQAGSGETASLGGKRVPYAAEFHLPGGISLFFSRQNSASGLYATEPRLFLKVSPKLAADLEKLNVPDSVELHALGFDLQTIMTASRDPDRSPRSRALRLLGGSGLDTPEIEKAFEDAAKEEDQYVRSAGEKGLEALKELRKPECQKVTRQVAAFLESHPRTHRVPAAAELMEILKSTDERYMTDGFTARGVLVEGGKPMNWVVTMGNEKLVVQKSAIGEDAVGNLDDTVYVGPERMGHVQRSQYWIEGRLIQSKPSITREPVGNTYDIYLGRLLWPLGRGFTRRFDSVTEVSERPDGMLSVVATGEDDLGLRWELIVDPSADYLVRQSRGIRRRDGTERFTVDAAGALERDGRWSNHTMRWVEGASGEIVSIAVHEISVKPDIDLIFRVEDMIRSDADQ